jgi:Cu+-exporting ATPase
MIFAWVLPYAVPSFITSYTTVNGNTLYILLMLTLSSIIQLGVGNCFYKGAYNALKNRSANMDVLVVLGTTSAWLYGIVLCFVGHSSMNEMDKDGIDAAIMQIQMHTHNFEISSTLITVILIGKFLESITKKQTVEKLSQLASLKESKAILV